MANAIDSTLFRNALGCFATGVTIVTTRDAEGRDVGLTANSFNSVSLDPPMVLWSLSKHSLSLPAFKSADYFAVHILSSEQETLSALFARRGADKFAGLQLTRGHGGIPLLDGCAARFECKMAFQHEGGDHIIFVGEVIAFEHFDEAPLLFHGGSYATVKKKTVPAPQAPQADAEDADFSHDFLGFMLGRAYHQLFSPLRAELKRRQLDEIDYYVLGLLASAGSRSVAELGALIGIAGVRFDDYLARDLAARGLVSMHGDGGNILGLTPHGRKTILEIIAVAKSIEADAQSDLSHEEVQALKISLRSIIRRSNPGLPVLWRKKD